jgi:hypothetical protein
LYEFSLTLAMPFDRAMGKVGSAQMSEHLGIVGDVDGQAIFRDETDKEIRPYHILGACNTKLADRVTDNEPVAVRCCHANWCCAKPRTGKISVVSMDPMTVIGLTDSDEPLAVAAETRVMLGRVVDTLS